MESYYECLLDLNTKSSLKIFLLRNVQNSNIISENIKNGVWKCAAVNPSLILDPFQIAVAANRAVVARMLGNMVMKTVHGEILYNLSLSKNIAQSLTKFGVKEQNTFLLCFIINEIEDQSEEVLTQVNGEQTPISELFNYTDLKQIQGAYKLNNIQSHTNILDIIVSRMVTKNFVSFK